MNRSGMQNRIRDFKMENLQNISHENLENKHSKAGFKCKDIWGRGIYNQNVRKNACGPVRMVTWSKKQNYW